MKPHCFHHLCQPSHDMAIQGVPHSSQIAQVLSRPYYYLHLLSTQFCDCNHQHSHEHTTTCMCKECMVFELQSLVCIAKFRLHYHHKITLSIYDYHQYAIKTKVLGQSTHSDVLCLISLKQTLVDQYTAEPLLCNAVGFNSHVQGDGLASAGCHTGNRV